MIVFLVGPSVFSWTEGSGSGSVMSEGLSFNVVATGNDMNGFPVFDICASILFVERKKEKEGKERVSDRCDFATHAFRVFIVLSYY